MKNHFASPDPTPSGDRRQLPRWLRLLLAGGALVLLIVILRSPRSAHWTGTTAVPRLNAPVLRGAHPAAGWAGRFTPHTTAPAATAKEIVAGKIAQFARSRRELAQALARRHQVEVSGDVDRFFAAVESGHWEDIEKSFSQINGGDSSAGHSNRRSPDIEHLWPAIIDAYGAAEQVHEWPAQQLLDYGNAVLDSLRPGMVYVGGTDNGRWIPELLNDTSEGERHVILTQNALADGTYLDYLRLQYDDRLATLSDADSQRAFQDYVADAEKRLRHDQEHPDEPSQIRPGEDVRMMDGKVGVSGQVAVMAINEKLLETLREKNPDLAFAIQESSPLQGTYAQAAPLGPLMELGARAGQDGLTAEQAAQSLDYWKNTAQQLLADPETTGSTTALKAYSHDTVAAANLLAAHHFTDEAEQAYRLATRLWPESPESAYALAGLLARGGRVAEAQQVLADFAQQSPDQKKASESASAATRLVSPAPKPSP